MPYTLERVAKKPIIVIRIFAPYNPTVEVPVIHEATNELSQNIEGKVHRIVDFTESGLTFQQVVFGLVEAVKARKGGVADERFISTYVVGSDEMAKFMVESIAQKQYGGHDVKAYGTLEQALKYVESLLKAPA
jgi:hypothetical protein